MKKFTWHTGKRNYRWIWVRKLSERRKQLCFVAEFVCWLILQKSLSDCRRVSLFLLHPSHLKPRRPHGQLALTSSHRLSSSVASSVNCAKTSDKNFSSSCATHKRNTPYTAPLQNNFPLYRIQPCRKSSSVSNLSQRRQMPEHTSSGIIVSALPLSRSSSRRPEPGEAELSDGP